MPNLIDFAEASLSDQFNLFKFSKISAPGVLGPHSRDFLVLVLEHGGDIRFFVHVMKIEDLIVYFLHGEDFFGLFNVFVEV